MSALESGVGVAVAGLAIAAALGGGVVLAEFGYRMTAHYAPKYEQVRRDTFEQSQAYVEGQRRDIANLSLDWHDPKTSPEQKAAIRSLALQRIGGLPEHVITSDIAAFRAELQGSNQ